MLAVKYLSIMAAIEALVALGCDSDYISPNKASRNNKGDNRDKNNKVA